MTARLIVTTRNANVRACTVSALLERRVQPNPNYVAFLSHSDYLDILILECQEVLQTSEIPAVIEAFDRLPYQLWISNSLILREQVARLTPEVPVE